MTANVIETRTPPPCGLCRARRRETWNGREPDAIHRAGQPHRPADFYVRVRGTTGLFRHLCRTCRTATRDVIMARFVAPKEG